MRRFEFRSLADGSVHPHSFSTNDQQAERVAAANAPSGYEAVEVSPAAVAASESTDTVRRLSRDEAAKLDVQSKILELERRQARPLRELALDPENAGARARVKELDVQIAELREQL